MISRWFVNKVTVEAYIGAGSEGDVYGTPVVVSGWLSDSQAVIRQAFGQETVATTAFYTTLADGAQFTPEARVTVNGRTSRVVKVNSNDTGGLMPNVDHVAVGLT
jgi:hypothetical protein